MCIRDRSKKERDSMKGKIQTNLSRYADWESHQNSLMDQAINDMNEVFEQMDYKITKKTSSQHKNNSKLGTGVGAKHDLIQTEEASKKIKLWKLANLFDFKHAQNGLGSTMSPIGSNNTVISNDNCYSYISEPLDGCSRVGSTCSEGRQQEKKSNTSTFIDGVSRDSNNLLGVPPPDYIEPAISSYHSKSSEQRHNRQTQLLLHDLISGDICDT